jgi:hypothetical protein
VKATEEILIHVGYDKKRLKKIGAHPIFDGKKK